MTRDDELWFGYTGRTSESVFIWALIGVATAHRAQERQRLVILPMIRSWDECFDGRQQAALGIRVEDKWQLVR